MSEDQDPKRTTLKSCFSGKRGCEASRFFVMRHQSSRQKCMVIAFRWLPLASTSSQKVAGSSEEPFQKRFTKTMTGGSPHLCRGNGLERCALQPSEKYFTCPAGALARGGGLLGGLLGGLRVGLQLLAHLFDGPGQREHVVLDDAGHLRLRKLALVGHVADQLGDALVALVVEVAEEVDDHGPVAVAHLDLQVHAPGPHERVEKHAGVVRGHDEDPARRLEDAVQH
eukprot:scaffold4399_cov115-Pinguiococcus_pyrenoidosus.AAC.1